MLSNQRRFRILRHLEEAGSAKVSHLSSLLKVSAVTIRKDLMELERQGLITTEHGGAYSNSAHRFAGDLGAPSAENLDAKRRIGAAAAQFVDHGDTLIIHAGSTTAEFAKQIVNKRNLTVITTSLTTAVYLSAHKQIKLYVTGGEHVPGRDTLAGPQAAQFFEGVFVDKLFMSAVGLSQQTGISYSGASEMVVQKAMIKSARKVFLLVDSSKLGKQSLASLGDITMVHTLITDSGISDEYRRWLLGKKIELVIADGKSAKSDHG